MSQSPKMAVKEKKKHMAMNIKDYDKSVKGKWGFKNKETMGKYAKHIENKYGFKK